MLVSSPAPASSSDITISLGAGDTIVLGRDDISALVVAAADNPAIQFVEVEPLRREGGAGNGTQGVRVKDPSLDNFGMTRVGRLRG